MLRDNDENECITYLSVTQALKNTWFMNYKMDWTGIGRGGWELRFLNSKHLWDTRYSTILMYLSQLIWMHLTFSAIILTIDPLASNEGLRFIQLVQEQVKILYEGCVPISGSGCGYGTSLSQSHLILMHQLRETMRLHLLQKKTFFLIPRSNEAVPVCWARVVPGLIWTTVAC